MRHALQLIALKAEEIASSCMFNTEVEFKVVIPLAQMKCEGGSHDKKKGSDPTSL